MDAFARGFKIAHKMAEDGVLADFVAARYGSYRKGIGRRIMSGKCSLADLEAHILAADEPELRSGREEMLENIVNQYIR